MPSNKKLLQAAAGSAGGDNLYPEDVFSTYLYEGTATTNNIVNGVDLTEGGLVWFKTRDDVEDHNLVDSERGSNKGLESNTADAETGSAGFSTFNSNGFTLTGGFGKTNSTSSTYASWTFRKAEKFFDVQTWTGNGVTGRTVSHNLGSVPGSIIIKRTDAARSWIVYHQSTGNGYITKLDQGAAEESSALFNSTTPTDALFTLNNDVDVNASGGTYVAYLFASDAGGFGDDGDESIIKCGSYTGNGNIDGPTVTLGFEPQWLMIKGTGGGDWTIFDNMRGLAVGGNDSRIWANQRSAENNGFPYIDLQPTGFKLQGSTGGAANGSGSNYIYIAIRRPMKTPESGTEVLSTVAYTGTGADKFLTSSSVVDLAFNKKRTSGDWTWTGRLQGAGRKLVSNGDFSEGTDPNGIKGLDYNNGVLLGTNGDINGNGDTYISYMLSRATGAFDVVAYTGDGASLSHNLGVVPEFIITKARGTNGSWRVTSSATTGVLYIDANDAKNGTDSFQTLTPCTATTMNLSGISQNTTNISYLFGTVAGVSKVGSVVHSGTTNVDCGFSAGARFVMAKRTDASGDWFIWTSVSGIVSGDDPYVRWNVSSAEVTNTDYIDPLSSGFTLTSSFTAGTYIFLAIA